jgi:membrane protease YdiL (CAAX protease family)
MPADPLVHDRQSQASFNLFGLRLPWKASLAVILTTTLVLLDFYVRLTSRYFPTNTFRDIMRSKALDRTALYLLVPLLVIVLVFRERPSAYGFAWGDWRAGLKITLIAWIAAAPLLVFAARNPAVIDYYTVRYQDMTPLERLAVVSLDLFGWEFVFRGFLLFALYPVAGPVAIVIQAVPFAMGHIGKPALETLSTIFGGLAFGWVAWRTRSFLYPWLIHCFILALTVFVALASA